MRSLIFALLLGLVIPAQANDGSVARAGEGGRLRLLDRESAHIRMVREWVRLDLYPDEYAVQATFIFRNDGPATTVAMGFPERGSGGGDGAGDYRQYRTVSGFRHFRTTVDGRAVRVRRHVAEADTYHYNALWVKTVAFAAGQQRTVRVAYRAAPGHEGYVGWGQARTAGYLFTGGNWKGRLERADLTVISHVPGVTLASAVLPDPHHVRAAGHRGNRYFARWVDWQAEGDFTLHFATTCAGRLSVPQVAEQPPFPYDFTLRNPGEPARVDWAPAAIRHGRTAYVRLRALHDYLRTSPERIRKYGALLAWDARTKAATLTLCAHTFRFVPGQAEMLVDGKTRVLLPGRPFFGPQMYADEPPSLYVPLRPLLDVVGGHAQIDARNQLLFAVTPPAR